MIFNPKSFGAKADGSHDDTNAIQQAIDKAFFSGGGRIVLKNGVFLSGTIYLIFLWKLTLRLVFWQARI